MNIIKYIWNIESNFVTDIVIVLLTFALAGAMNRMNKIKIQTQSDPSVKKDKTRKFLLFLSGIIIIIITIICTYIGLTLLPDSLKPGLLLVIIGYSLMLFFVSQFSEIFFDDLFEKMRQKKLNKIKNTYKTLIENGLSHDTAINIINKIYSIKPKN